MYVKSTIRQTVKTLQAHYSLCFQGSVSEPFISSLAINAKNEKGLHTFGTVIGTVDANLLNGRR